MLRVYTCVVAQELLTGSLQIVMMAFLIWSLQGIEDQSPHHQVQEHPNEDEYKSGAMHGWTSAGICPFLVLSTAGIVPLGDEAAKPAESIKESWKHFMVKA